MNPDLLAELRLSLDIYQAETKRLEVLRDMANFFTIPLSELIQAEIKEILTHQTPLRREYTIQHSTRVKDLYKHRGGE